MTTNFERAKFILDAMLAEMGSDGHEAVKDQISKLAQSYQTIWNSEINPIDYSAPATQAAYVFTYLGAHADLVYQTLNGASPDSKAIFNQPKVKIACIGGGPGSDLLGAVKFAERLKKQPKKLK